MFDPDNGLEEQTERHTATGPKFLYLDEIEPFARRGQSVVIYQHAGRNGSVRADQRGLIERHAAEARDWARSRL